MRGLQICSSRQQLTSGRVLNTQVNWNIFPTRNPSNFTGLLYFGAFCCVRDVYDAWEQMAPLMAMIAWRRRWGLCSVSIPVKPQMSRTGLAMLVKHITKLPVRTVDWRGHPSLDPFSTNSWVQIRQVWYLSFQFSSCIQSNAYIGHIWSVDNYPFT